MKTAGLCILLLIGVVAFCTSGVAAASDEGHIVWVSDRAGDGRLNLWVMNPDGSGKKPVTKTFTQALYPAISPDGLSVAFSTQDSGAWRIHIIKVDGSGLRRFTYFSSAVPDWSPDGLRMVFNSDHDDEPTDTPDLWAMNLNETNLVELVDSPPTADFNAQWSPDGERILFVSDRSGNFDLYVMNLDGSGLTQLTTDNASDYNPQWSPDGERIVFVSDRSGNADLFVMASDGAGVVQLTDHEAFDSDPAWSPNGDRIVFVSTRSGHYDLWVIRADGSRLTQITDDEALDVQPDWR